MANPEKQPNLYQISSESFTKSMCSLSRSERKDGWLDRCFRVSRENKWQQKRWGFFFLFGRWAKIVWHGNVYFNTGKAMDPKKAGCAIRADDKRCVYTDCVLLMKRKTKQGAFGWTTKWFSQTKLKGFSFVRIWEEKIFSRTEFSDNIWWTVVCFWNKMEWVSGKGSTEKRVEHISTLNPKISI